MKINSKKALTLVELLVSAYILLIGICGMLSLFINSMTSSKSAWDTTIAAAHGQFILEEMQRMPSSADIINRDWDEWALSNKLKTLPDEQIKADFAYAPNNLLNIKLSVAWKHLSYAKDISFETLLVK